MFSTALVLGILRLVKLKTEGQTIYRENLIQSYKTQILAYPGLA